MERSHDLCGGEELVEDRRGGLLRAAAGSERSGEHRVEADVMDNAGNQSGGLRIVSGNGQAEAAWRVGRNASSEGEAVDGVQGLHDPPESK